MYTCPMCGRKFSAMNDPDIFEKTGRQYMDICCTNCWLSVAVFEPDGISYEEALKQLERKWKSLRCVNETVHACA